MEPVVRFAALRAVQPAPPGQPLTAPVYDPSAIAEGAFLPSVRAASRDAVTGQRLAQSYLANRGPNPHAALLDALDDDLRGMAPAKQLLETLRLRTDRDPADWDPSALRRRPPRSHSGSGQRGGGAFRRPSARQGDAGIAPRTDSS